LHHEKESPKFTTSKEEEKKREEKAHHELNPRYNLSRKKELMPAVDTQNYD
jgi:hypothetical protein